MASLGLAYLDSDLDSDPEVVPESPPAVPSLQTEPLSQITMPSLPVEVGLLAIPSPPSPVPSISMPIPPLDQQFSSPEEGIAAINTFARVKKTVRLCCDRGRTHRDRLDHDRQRQTTTIANDCPFSLSLRLNLETNTWSLTMENGTHNHEPTPASTHAAQRSQELSEKTEDIRKELEMGLPTRKILTGVLNNDLASCLTSRDIYNLRRRVHMEFLAGRTPL
ncbi:hypothetical protein N7471_006900 [Penicillium samsonianum]|uniref:uncharacterized protein n=1 Tax=Penicillium samsonianum TaxID=1882272 RepID=UPI002548EC44|nr:uncharacterized protein N7471_006900 [Penicillium samsonianum]KAJ6131685.1 hypothetical protein N7471_006900 [Penicillium samsonianum]